MAIYHRNSQSENASTWAHAYACTQRPHTHTHTWSAPSNRTDSVTDGYADGRRAQSVMLMACCLQAARFLSSSATHTHTHTHIFRPFARDYPGEPVTRKVKPIWISLKQETVSGSSISWPICKPAPRSRQITTPAPHQPPLSFYRPDVPPAAQPTTSKD